MDLHVTPILLGDGDSLSLLKSEFPELESIELANFPITYPRNGHFAAYFARRFFKMRKQLKAENQRLKSLVEETKANAIISDNRYGLYHPQIPCVIITHQVSIRAGILSMPLTRLVHKYIKRFDHCWVPDVQGALNLAGELSKTNKGDIPNLTYVGPLSRFHNLKRIDEQPLDFLCIISGPEPQRTEFENEVLRELAAHSGRHVVVRGSSSPIDSKIKFSANTEIFDLLNHKELSGKIAQAKYLITRSGYSSLMDLYALDRTAAISPTPGQFEQEYLAQYHKDSGRFVVFDQGSLDLESIKKQLDQLGEPASQKKSQNFKEILADFVDALY